MIINQSIGFSFIHIPKAAGTSVSSFLSPLNGPLDLEIGGTVFGEKIQPAYSQRYGIKKHSRFEVIAPILEKARFDRDPFIFSFVRNPYFRLQSIFGFLRKWRDYNPELLERMLGFKSYTAFLESELYAQRPGPDDIFHPQVTWLKENGAIPSRVRLFKVEEIDDAFSEIKSELISRGADPLLFPETIPHANKTGHASVEKTLVQELPKELKDKIGEFYRMDFEEFGYDL